MAFAELRWLLDVPDPVVPTKEEIEQKYKAGALRKGKENFWFFTTTIADVMFLS